MRSDNPTVVIVIPAYNPGPYLREALDSVLAQTFACWECIVVDDGSDEDLSYVEALDSRIRLIRQRNQGVSVARNRGIRDSQLPFVALLDADDYWASTFLEKTITKLTDNPSAGMCNTTDAFVNEHGDWMSPGFSREIRDYVDLLKENGISSSAVLIRRKVFEKVDPFDPKLTHGEDYDFWLRVARQFPIAHVASVESYCRRRGSSASSNSGQMGRGVTRVLRMHLSTALATRDHAAVAAARDSIRGVRLGWGAQAFEDARLALHEDRYVQAVRSLISAVQLAPGYTLRQGRRSVLRHVPFLTRRPA